MKAIVCTKYGSPDVLQLKQVEKPAPTNTEVLIRIHATTVSSSDVMIRSSKFPPMLWIPGRLFSGITRPRFILGYELAGEIEAIGKDVKLFSEGDQVYGVTMGKMSCYAEYVCVPEKGALLRKPPNLTYEEAAAIGDGATTALYFLKDKADIQRGQKVLVYGASGSIGTFAVQLAKYFGAEVTGVCSSTNLELAKSLGADKVIDYTKEDFTESGETYDVIFDTIGKSSSSPAELSRSMGSLKANGRFLTTVGGLIHYLMMLWTSMKGGRKVLCPISANKIEPLIFLNDLVEEGKLKSVIDRSYTLEQIAEAHRYVDKGHKKGNVAITI